MAVLLVKVRQDVHLLQGVQIILAEARELVHTPELLRAIIVVVCRNPSEDIRIVLFPLSLGLDSFRRLVPLLDKIFIAVEAVQLAISLIRLD